MTKKLVRGLGVGWVVLLVAASCVSTEDPDTEHNTSGTDRSGADIQSALDQLPSAHVIDTDAHGIPTFVAGQLGRLQVNPQDQTMDLKAPMQVLSQVFRASAEDLQLRDAQTDPEGDQHFRLTQTKNGFEVIGGELNVHARNGVIIAANGAARHDLKAPTAPKLAESEAITAAKSASGGMSDMVVADKAPLAYRPATAGETMDLVYVVKVTGTDGDGTPVNTDVLVNASDGSIREKIPHIHTAKNREVHNLNHGTSLPGPVAQTEGGAVSADKSVANNYTLLGTVYDCYKTLFNRDSFDNKGAKMISSVHYSTKYNNAYWDGTQMVYGDGDGTTLSDLSVSMDVSAHELTHAVTERTSNLTYSGESGGLNEAMSDILGNTCEWFRDGQPAQPSANNFMVGEDVYTPGTSGDALRYMSDPAKDGASLDYYPNYNSGIDVHYSSGIANLAFYLLAHGGTHPRGKTSNTVTGIGIAKAAQIFYKADTSIFTASETFAKAKTDTEQAATQLGYTAAEIASVTAAWAAVGVGVVAPPPAGAVALTNGVAVTGVGATKGAAKYFTLDVPAGATNITITTSGGSGDSDLYVKFGSNPTTATYDCRPYKSGNAESCTFASSTGGTYYIMLNAYATFSGVSIVGSYGGGGSSSSSSASSSSSVASSSSSGGSSQDGTCVHPVCSTGVKLTSGCSTVATKVCAGDSYCCSTSWDSYCVSEVSSLGGGSCP